MGEEQRDVLDDTDHSPLAGDESTVSEDDDQMQRGHLRKKQSTKVVYGNTRSLRRRRLRRGLQKAKYGDTVSEDHSTDEPEPHPLGDDELYEDTQESKSKSMQSEASEEEEEEEQTYFRRGSMRQRRNRRKRYLYKNDSDTDKDAQIIDSSTEEDMNEDNDVQQQPQQEQEDLDEEQYKYYQQKKRNSKVHLLDKDEFEKEYNSILQ